MRRGGSRDFVQTGAAITWSPTTLKSTRVTAVNFR